ncbi:MAG: cation transporter [Dehalococcoidia bacterium]|nr:cation transporter [Dehalococcoidia bacterium]MSQ17709.1 cation transporter [Dehalococcoidia bacterium]
MDSCCQTKAEELEVFWSRQTKTLWAVLGINASMFGVEVVAGLLAASTALLADSTDMLGDALVYAFSLMVVGRSVRWRAGAALLKGGIMAGFAVVVLAQAGYRFFVPEVPDFRLMGIIGGLALAANVTCLLLLTRHRHDDLNMRSTWLCSRNDIIANVGVLVAAAAVFATNSRWPDLAVGLGITAVYARSAVYVLLQAVAELRSPASVHDHDHVPDAVWQPLVLLLPKCAAGTCPAKACRCGAG